MRTTTTERFTTALSTLLHADFGAMTYPQLKKAAKGLIMKPHKLSHGELLEELSQLREVSQQIIEGPTTERLPLRLWDYQNEMPRLATVMTQEERRKMNRKNALKRLKKVFSEEEFKKMSRSSLNRRMGASLNVYRNESASVWFNLTDTTIHLLQVEGTLEGCEEGDIDTDSVDILSFDWKNLPDLKKIVTQVLDSRSDDEEGPDDDGPDEGPDDDGPDNHQQPDDNQQPDNSQHDDSIDENDNTGTDIVPDDDSACDEAPGNDDPDDSAPDIDDSPDEPVDDSQGDAEETGKQRFFEGGEEHNSDKHAELLNDIFTRVQQQLDLQPANMSWSEEVAYEAHKMLKEAPFEVPGLCLNHEFQLQFTIERRPYYYTIDEDSCSATFQCMFEERDDAKIPVYFESDNVISAAMSLRFDVERALDIDVPKDRFVGLPTAQEIDGRSAPENGPTNQGVASVASASSVYEAYFRTLQDLGDPAFSAAGEQGGTFVMTINGKACTLGISPTHTMRGNFEGSQEVGGKYTYTAMCDRSRQRIKTDEPKDTLVIMDLLVRTIGPADALYDVYDDINLTKCITEDTVAYFVIQPDDTFAIHVIKDGNKDDYAVLTLDENGTVQPPIASIR